MKNAPKLTKFFNGRSNELNLLHKKLSGKIKRTVIVSGLPGIGKTQFALAYLKKYGMNYHQIFWIIEKSIYKLTQTIMKFEEVYKTSSSVDEIIQDASSNLYNFKKGKTLVVFDSASEKKVFNETFPNAKANKDVYFVLTTQNCCEDEWKNMEMLHLDVLLKEDAQSLIKSQLKYFQKDSIETLVEKLKYYPLILQQAVSCILCEKISIENYLKILDEDPQVVLRYQLSNEQSFYTKTVYEVFSDIINKINIEKETSEILSILSYLASDKISIHLFYDSELGKETTDKILKKLHKFSLVCMENNFIKVNSIVQLSIRIYIEHGNKTIKAFEMVDSFLEDIYKKSDESEYGLLIAKEVIPHVEFFSKHLEEMCGSPKTTHLPRIKFEFLENTYKILTWLYYCVKKYHSRKALLQKYINLMKEKNNDENSQSIEVARLVYYLAFTEYAIRNHKTADTLYEKAFAIFETELGVDNLETAYLLRNWADIKCSMKKYPEADSLNEKVKRTYEKELGSDHLNMAILLSEMAKSKSRQGKHEEADDLFQKSLEIFERSVNVDSIQMIHMLNQWARHDFEKRDFQKAYEKFERCLPVYERSYGKNHPSAKRVYWYLEDAKKRIGEWKIILLYRAVEISCLMLAFECLGKVYRSTKINRTASLSIDIQVSEKYYVFEIVLISFNLYFFKLYRKLI